MGIAINGLAACARHFQDTGPLGKTIQVGRQGLYVGPEFVGEADRVLAACGVAGGYAQHTEGTHYADERLFAALGADPVMSIDASAYEGATYVHDFNDPIPAHLTGSFDTVIDGGSLEHIFNVPTALANMMNMLRVGGHILHIVPANDWFGHGFYQFGPELFFRVYQPGSGFELKSISLSNVGRAEPMLVFSDRGAQGARNEIERTGGPAELLVVAQKKEDVRPFAKWPQQGDYQSAWGYVA